MDRMAWLAGPPARRLRRCDLQIVEPARILINAADLDRRLRHRTFGQIIIMCGHFTLKTSRAKIAELITPKDIQIPVEVIFQSIETLHQSCPNNLGDWYFTGNYPTPGGNRVVNRAFMNYMEGKNVRGY